MSEVRQILDELNIEVLREKTKHDGSAELNAICPWHYEGDRPDHNPSWWINEATGAHLCFSCQFSGGLAYLAEKVLDISFAEASAWVRSRSRSLEVLNRLDRTGKREYYEPPPMNRARILSYHEPPVEALVARRIDAESAERYQVRWDPKQDAWILPLLDPDTFEPMGFQLKGEGNRLFRNVPSNVRKSTTLFGIHLLTGSGTVVLVESPLDAVRLWRLGYVAVASCGSYVSEAQMNLIVARADRLVLAMDNDEAGNKAVREILGLRKNYRPDKFGTDWSRRIPIQVADYSGYAEKDPGDIERGSRVCALIDLAVPAFRWKGPGAA